MTSKRVDGEGRQILIPFHGFGPLIVRRDGKYHCSEGIARVVRQFVRALADEKFTVIVTSREQDVARVYGFLVSGVEDVARLQILNIDAVEDSGASGLEKQLFNTILHKAKTLPILAFHKRFKSLLKSGAYLSLMKSLVTYFTVVIAKVGLRLRAKLKTSGLTPIRPIAVGYVDRLNADDTISDVLIPHYCMFPELQALKDKKVTLYLPDYLPHFYQGSLEMGSSRENEEIGRQLSTMAERVVTNSAFTKEYLPRTGLNIAAEKIVHIPLPFLHEESDEQEHGTDAVELSLPEHFVFYPTRNRPSKRLKDFVATIEKANKQLKKMGRSERIHGVMTTHLSPGAISKAAQPYVTILEELSDSQLGKVYNKSLCLLFTSEMEGNFPTQITEALNLRVPVVASAMPLVVAELGDVGDALDLQKTGDIDGYVDRILDILDNRPSVIEKQATAREFALENFAYEKFRDRLCEVFIPSKN
ncbi:glycosyltransferase involved in cell wall biosynthesis [Phyllobacterium trifolii]|uniref:Glycosyltransferase involved in cell wall biosynthesis n=1 Tax=Phyllobacterium trifolii TaxID=300193 RepID=A0A839U0U2_9HYPH|nr:glycosyltransferase [Phyllobacterium trifolii]MBB3143623.1 glycosyltransferase involved in cell wall biosynthesis [Phyllobacterium trifolii]